MPSMRRPPDAVLFASPDDVEAQFYEAMQSGDVARLMQLWADDEEIVCVHPGGMRVIGAQAIAASFEAVFAQGGVPVAPEQLHRLHTPGTAVHHLVERISVSTAEGEQVGWVLATNVYIHTAQGWRMVAHHASAAPEPPPAQASTAPRGSSTLH